MFLKPSSAIILFPYNLLLIEKARTETVGDLQEVRKHFLPLLFAAHHSKQGPETMRTLIDMEALMTKECRDMALNFMVVNKQGTEALIEENIRRASIAMGESCAQYMYGATVIAAEFINKAIDKFRSLIGYIAVTDPSSRTMKDPSRKIENMIYLIMNSRLLQKSPGRTVLKKLNGIDDLHPEASIANLMKEGNIRWRSYFSKLVAGDQNIAIPASLLHIKEKVVLDDVLGHDRGTAGCAPADII